MDYKKYSLEKLQEWVHDCLSSGEASPHEIYSAIREAVREDYYYHKDRISRASGLLELMSGHRPVNLDEYYEGNVKYDSIEQMLENHKKPLTCDKDDPSPECKNAWNDFWDNGHTEALTYGEMVAKEDKVVKWQLPVEADPSGEYFVTFPDDLLEAANLKEGDQVEWVDNVDGSYLLKKVTKTIGMEEC